MNYLQLVRCKSKLQGTLYYEFQPGNSAKGKVWSDESVYVDERAIGLLEPAIASGFPDYHPYSFQDIPKRAWTAIANRLDLLAQAAAKGDESYLRENCRLESIPGDTDLFDERNRSKLESLARDLADWIRSTLKQNDWIALLGL
jgi:hypothetical protein